MPCRMRRPAAPSRVDDLWTGRIPAGRRTDWHTMVMPFPSRSVIRPARGEAAGEVDGRDIVMAVAVLDELA